MATTREFRAVFSYPPSIISVSPDSYGPPRASVEAAYQDRPHRPEESHGWLSGIETREVTEWVREEP